MLIKWYLRQTSRRISTGFVYFSNHIMGSHFIIFNHVTIGFVWMSDKLWGLFE